MRMDGHSFLEVRGQRNRGRERVHAFGTHNHMGFYLWKAPVGQEIFTLFPAQVDQRVGRLDWVFFWRKD